MKSPRAGRGLAARGCQVSGWVLGRAKRHERTLVVLVVVAVVCSLGWLGCWTVGAGSCYFPFSDRNRKSLWLKEFTAHGHDIMPLGVQLLHFVDEKAILTGKFCPFCLCSMKHSAGWVFFSNWGLLFAESAFENPHMPIIMLCIKTLGLVIPSLGIWADLFCLWIVGNILKNSEVAMPRGF